MTSPMTPDGSDHSLNSNDEATITISPEKISGWLKMLKTSPHISAKAVIVNEGALTHNELSSVKKRGGPAAVMEKSLTKRSKIIEQALREADASIMQHITYLKSATAQEKAEGQGGLATPVEQDSPDEMMNVPGNSVHETQFQEGTHATSCASPGQVHVGSFQCSICGIGFAQQIGFFEHLKSHYDKMKKPARPRGRPRKYPVVSKPAESTDVIVGDSVQEEVKVEEEEEEEEEEDEEEEEEDSGDGECFRSTIDVIGKNGCHLCGAAFSARKELIEHLKKDHHIAFRRGRRPKYPMVEPSEDGTYACPYCQRKFVHKNSLTYHLRTHTGERPHRCDVCGKCFLANGALKVHMRVHTGDRPFKCDDCGREFRQEGDLKYHRMSLHSDIRQFQCEYCGKSFARKYSLTVHRRVHTGERNYVCEFCHKGFRASSYLLTHRKIHTGERPHLCPVCHKSFRMRSDMKRHLEMHSRNDPDATVNALSAHLQDLVSEEVATVTTIQDEATGMTMAVIPDENGQMITVPIQLDNVELIDGDFLNDQLIGTNQFMNANEQVQEEMELHLTSSSSPLTFQLNYE